MATQIDEHPAFFDSAGRPLVDGSVFIGLVGADPEANPITIYSDRELTVVLANPQTIDALGRATNKIWIPGEYSMEVQDSNSVQVYIELENGVTAGTGGATTITNILGTNTITGEGTVTPVTSYGEDEIFIFQSFGANTGAVTLNWDGVGAKALVYDFDIPLEENHIVADQTVVASYNSGEDNFQWLNPNRTVVYGNEGSSIASGATVELANATGNVLGITGITTITSFGTTPAGSRFWLEFLGAAQITYNAVSLIIPAQANYTTTAGDVVLVMSLGNGNNSIQIFKVDGRPVTIDLPTNPKIVVATYDLSTATGTQSITGAGFTPRFVRIYGAIAAGENSSMWGSFDGTLQQVIYSNQTTNFWALNTTRFTFYQSAAGNTQATVAFTSDGCDLSWVKTSSPIGTLTEIFEFHE